MAKELPYFKFEPNQWENGNIQMLSREDKGLFIDLCSLYWSRTGDVSFKLASQKLCGGNATALNSLCDEKIIEHIEGNIYIKFLEEQLLEFDSVSQQNSKNAKEGWEKRRKNKASSERNAIASIPQCENDAIREEKRRGDKKREEKKREDIKPNGSVDFANQPQSEKIDFEKLKMFFNDNRGLMPEVKTISDSRKNKIKSLEKKYGKELIQIVIEKARDSDLLQGKSGSGWIASFDWIIKPENFLKIAEDNYLNRDNGKQKAATGQSKVEYSDDFKRKIAQRLQS